MLLCDHFIYTTGIIGTKTGYQVVAKSNGIRDEILDELEGYFFPVGIQPIDFTESRSLIILSNGHAAHSIIKNIGIGFDGRENTLYNHTIILTSEQFQKLNNDSRSLVKHHIQNPNISGKLEKLEIKEIELEQPWDDLDKLPRSIVESFYDLIFSEKKIALRGVQYNDFIPNMLSFLPIELRQISFSSFVSEPLRQPHFKIIQIRDNSKVFDFGEYVKFDVTDLVPFYKNDEDIMFERSIKYFVDILKNRNEEAIKYIINEFSEIEGSNKDKIKILAHYEQIRNTPDEKKARRFAYDILQVLNNFDDNTSIKYLNRIKQFLNEDDYQKYSLQLEIDFIVNKFSDKEINLENILNMFHSLRIETSESRYQLLKQLVKKRLEDMVRKGNQLLIDSRYYYQYGNEIMQIFIEEKSLHKCILDIFNDPNFKVIYKQGIYEIITQKAMLSEPHLIMDLLNLPVFDLKDEYDTRHFKKILRNIIQNPSFLDIINPQYIINISKSIFTRIQEVVKPNAHFEIDKSNLIQINKIVKLLIDSLNYFSGKEHNLDIKNELEKLIFILEQFLREHKISPRVSWGWNFDD